MTDLSNLKIFYHKIVAENPSSWFSKAEKSEYVANILLERYNNPKTRQDEHLHSFILMFLGFAMENYFKGCLIDKKTVIPIKNDNLNTNLKSHNLLNLYKKLFSQNTDIKTEELLKALEWAIMNAKYPVGLYGKEHGAGHTYLLDEKIKLSKEIFEKIKKESNFYKNN